MRTASIVATGRRWLSRLLFWRRPTRAQAQAGATEAAAEDHELVFGLAKSRVPSVHQLAHLSAVLSPKEKRWVRWWMVVAVVAALLLIGRWSFRHVSRFPASGGTLTEGLVGAPQYLNPVLARSQVDLPLTSLTFRGLLKLNQDFHLVPDLARNYSVSPDGKTYTVILPHGLHWSDGQALTAQDVVYTYETIADADFKSPLATIFNKITVAAPNDQTVVFHLPTAQAAFPSYLISGLLPAHLWSDSSAQSFPLAELNVKPVGDGPYRFQSVTKDSNGNIKSYTFVRNPNFSGPRPYLNSIVIKFYPDDGSATEAWRTNAIDTFGGITPDQLAGLSKRGAVTAWPISQLTAVFFNQRTNQALKSHDVREALALATNRSPMIDQALKHFGMPVFGPILPGYIGYNPDLQRYPYDPAKAKALLDQGGWKVNSQGLRQKGPQQLTFTFTTLDEPTYRAVADRLVADWRAIGANVEIKYIPVSRMQKDVIRPRQYEALLFGQVFEADGDPYPYWHSTQTKDPGFNLAIFFNKNIDQDLQDGQTQTDQAKRIKDYLDFQNLVAGDIPAIFLYQSEYLYLHPKNLQGIESKHLVNGSTRFSTIESWYRQTRLSWGKKK
ncbi:MAG: peptide ABC transporter substrate-binding protein [Candidatus Kerfeldbacteria bacterium]|nr:peptide ABC transporter substrate-binding protein [Candidatus Kerfeldbacteria bacterium]